MYVACPACKSLYAIQLAHLRAAGGELRCGACGARFNAAAAVFDDAHKALDYAEQQQHSVAREIDELVDRALGEVPEPGAADVHDTSQHKSEPVEESATPGGDQDALAANLNVRFEAELEPVEADVEAQDINRGALPFPAAVPEEYLNIYPVQADRDYYAQPFPVEFAVPEAAEGIDEAEVVPYLLDEPEMAGVAISWGAIAASLLLLALLGMQFAWQHRYRLAEHDGLRPAMEQFCALLQCDLPLRREPTQVEIVEREVRDHPAVKDALLINAAFVNRATFRQAYPVFQISFSDVSGTLVAIRRFAPQEYLLERRPIEQGIGAGEQAHVTLEVVDPGSRAVSFQFEFL